MDTRSLRCLGHGLVKATAFVVTTSVASLACSPASPGVVHDTTAEIVISRAAPSAKPASSNVSTTATPQAERSVEIRERPKPKAELGRALIREGSHYIGTYVCSQGETDADLEIERVSDDGDQIVVDLIFHFKHDAKSIVGAIRMHGAYDRSTNEIRLSPTEWVQQPPGYIGVAVVATLSANGGIIDGRMDHPSCGSIRVVRR
ncbi:MAG: hypothetical protein U0165_06695 [Polyangiaceae bacterium]